MTGELDVIDQDILEEVLRIGVEWLMTCEQPEDASVSHHGDYGKLGLGMGVSFCPTAPHGRYEESGSICVVVLNGGYEYTGPDPVSDTRRRCFTGDDIARFEAALRKAGAVINDSWNGAGCDSGSWCIDGMSPDLARSAQLYHDGCPEHGGPFCNGWQNGSYNKGCTYMSDAHQRLVPPVFPFVPDYERPAAAPSIGDRNLEAVLEALALLQPVAEDIGIVPSTLTVGRRGRVEDDEYVDEEGLGVTLPAEAALRIAELLKAAIDLGAI
jgi:hypothetical protein